ncbi:MAG: hypothetical protein HQL32_11130 [Planctomycetes bacterium]|nr:hypothetical protein [Planctomycetota bacterium]
MNEDKIIQTLREDAHIQSGPDELNHWLCQGQKRSKQIRQRRKMVGSSAGLMMCCLFAFLFYSPLPQPGQVNTEVYPDEIYQEMAEFMLDSSYDTHESLFADIGAPLEQELFIE